MSNQLDALGDPLPADGLFDKSPVGDLLLLAGLQAHSLRVAQAQKKSPDQTKLTMLQLASPPTDRIVSSRKAPRTNALAHLRKSSDSKRPVSLHALPNAFGSTIRAGPRVGCPFCERVTSELASHGFQSNAISLFPLLLPQLVKT